jgi:hypothetical protein
MSRVIFLSQHQRIETKKCWRRMKHTSRTGGCSESSHKLQPTAEDWLKWNMQVLQKVYSYFSGLKFCCRLLIWRKAYDRCVEQSYDNWLTVKAENFCDIYWSTLRRIITFIPFRQGSMMVASVCVPAGILAAFQEWPAILMMYWNWNLWSAIIIS